MIGAFYQPQTVLIDIDTLATLDERQLSAGLAEIIKYALLGDEEFLTWLESNITALLSRDKDALSYVIEHSCVAKAAIVSEDEKEQGVRALLNLGHTFGHAIENAKGYGVWLHGEAVGLGMLMAADLSHKLSMISAADVERVRAILKAAKLPISGVDGITAVQLRDLMSVDKKVLSGKLRLILLRSVGEADIFDDCPEAMIIETLNSYIK